MTVAASSPVAIFYGSGSTGPFTFTWQVNDEPDLALVKQPISGPAIPLVLGADYTVAGIATPTGGSVTLTVALNTGEQLFISSAVPYDQPLSIRDQGTFFPDVLEDALDRLTMQIKQVHAETQVVPDLNSINASAYATLAAADTAATAAGQLLVISTAWTVVPAALYSSIQVLPGGKINNSGPLSINGSFEAGLYQVFVGTGAVTGLKQAYPEWFGANSLPGITDMSAAAQAATTAAGDVLFGANSYKISGVTYTGKMSWKGVVGTKILSDGAVLTVTNGTGSQVDNLWLENITAPWIIIRDPTNWSATVTPVQSNALGYQPTGNDQDVWSGLTTAQQNQNIGPKISFSGNAQRIEISRIHGRFVGLTVADAQHSTVRDCNFQAGKDGWGGISFYNVNNQIGIGNRAINNVVSYSSISGICFTRNTDGEMSGNVSEYNGESGLKTNQDTTSGIDYRCYRMKIQGNTARYNYYDGIDFSMDYPHTGTLDGSHTVVGNKSYLNRQTGYFADGLNNQFVGNYAYGNGVSGIFLDCGYSQIVDNYAYDCNRSNTLTGQHQINITGDYNHVDGNYAHQLVTNGFPVWLHGANETVGTNTVIGGPFTQSPDPGPTVIPSFMTTGNAGIGVTPSFWNNTHTALDFGTCGVIDTDNVGDFVMNRNGYFNSSGQWIYKTTGPIQHLAMDSSGNFTLFTAPSGTAGTVATLTQRYRIDVNGNITTTGNTGIGVGSSPWNNTHHALDIGTSGVLDIDSAGDLALNRNGYFTGTGQWIYKTTGPMQHMVMDASGNTSILTAASGTAGTAATLAQKFNVDINGVTTAAQFKVSALNSTPASSSATGALGEIRYDANYMYVCVATNTWKRSALTTW